MSRLPEYCKVVTAYGGHLSNQVLPQYEAFQVAECAVVSTGRPVAILDAVTGKVAMTVKPKAKRS